MRTLRIVLALVVLAAVPLTAWAAPEGTVTWASHVSLVPTWLDPGETTTGTQFMITFALYDRTGSRTSSSCARASRSTTATR